MSPSCHIMSFRRAYNSYFSFFIATHIQLMCVNVGYATSTLPFRIAPTLTSPPDFNGCNGRQKLAPFVESKGVVNMPRGTEREL